MGIPISHWKVASFCLCGLIWWSLPVTCFLWSKGIFQRMCCFTWHAEEPESLRCVDCKSSKTTTERWLTRRLGFFCWMSMIQQTPSTKWIQNGVSCLCFLKENSKPKVWIQFWTQGEVSVSWDQRGGHRNSALILLSFDFPQGTPFVVEWSSFVEKSPTGGKRAVS